MFKSLSSRGFQYKTVVLYSNRSQSARGGKSETSFQGWIYARIILSLQTHLYPSARGPRPLVTLCLNQSLGTEQAHSQAVPGKQEGRPDILFH